MNKLNKLFASRYMQDVATQSEIVISRSIHTRVFDSSKRQFILDLFLPNNELAEYARRVVDHSGDNCYFQIEINELELFIKENDDFVLGDDISALLEYCEENKIDYLIHS